MRTPKHQKGSALVEFALVVPLLIALIYGSLYLTDLTLFKMKSQEISRYAAWGLATRPLSAYVSGIYPATQITSNMATRADVMNQYVDLDGAAQWSLPGVSRLTAAGQLGYMTLTSETAPLVPGIGGEGFAGNLSILGQLSRILGIGPNLDGAMASLYDKLGFDGSGYIKAQAPVVVSLPWMGYDAYRALLLAQSAAVYGVDLSPWSPVPGFVIADQDNEPIQTALLADPWRLQQGFGVMPPRSFGSGFQLTVRRMHRNIPRLIPVIGLFIPGTPDSDRLVVISRPYIEARTPMTWGVGAVDILNEISPFAFEGGISVFESGALYDESTALSGSPYLQELNSRGHSFMGCDASQKRGCR